MSSQFLPKLPSNHVMNRLNGSIQCPQTKIMVNRFPGRKVLGEHSPLAAGLEDIQDGIEDFQQGVGLPSTQGWVPGDERFQLFVLLWGEVTGVSFFNNSGHHRTPLQSIPSIVKRFPISQTASKCPGKEGISGRIFPLFYSMTALDREIQISFYKPDNDNIFKK